MVCEYNNKTTGNITIFFAAPKNSILERGMRWQRGVRLELEEAKSKMHLRKNIRCLNHSTTNTLYLLSVHMKKCRQIYTNSCSLCRKHKRTFGDVLARWEMRNGKWMRVLYLHTNELICLLSKRNNFTYAVGCSLLRPRPRHIPFPIHNTQYTYTPRSKHRQTKIDLVFKCRTFLKMLQTMCLHIEKRLTSVNGFISWRRALFYFLTFISFGCFHKQVVNAKHSDGIARFGSTDKLWCYYHATIYVHCMQCAVAAYCKNEAILARATII